MRIAIAHLRNRTRGEGGFTLAELLVAIVIQGLIMGALAMAFVGIMHGSVQVDQSLDKTGDARIAAQYIVSDARNSSGPELSLSDTTSCPGSQSSGLTPVVRFNWDSTDSDGSTVPNIVNYVKFGNSLLRRQCVNGALVSDRAVASSIASIAVACSPNADCSGTPTGLTVTITETTDVTNTSYQYSLSGTFRKEIGSGPPVNPRSIILLGSGTDCSLGATGIRVSGSGNLRVYGDAYVNATDGSTCKAMNISNSGVYRAGATNILTGGSCTYSGSSVCPTTTSFSPAVTDPYASVSPPSASDLPAQSGCASGTAQPGVYASTLSLTGVATCQLASGVYIFQNGLSMGNSSVLTSAAGGVLIYITGGSFSLTGAASVNLSAMTSGPYSGLVVWQAAADTNTVSFGNGGSITLNGALYAPSAEVSLTGAASNPYVTSIVAKTIFVGNSGVIVIGSPSTTPLSISDTALTNWTVNQPNYSYTLTGNGGDGIYSWAATNLPTGLTINVGTGAITGTPTQTGTKSVTITLTDQLGDTAATKSLSITINAAPSISTTSLTNGEVGASYSKTLAGSGGTTPSYSWSATGLPAGLSINSSTGVIYGTPTGSTGTSTVNLTLTDNAGATATKSLSLQVVSAVSITSGALPNGEKTLAYSQTPSASGGATAYTWSAIGLPAGLSFTASNGKISGTPTTPGSYTINLTVTDSLGGTDTEAYPVTILAQPSITGVTIQNHSGVAGTIDQGDSVSITFSQTMKASTFCSSWSSGDSTNYSITADNYVTVSVSNGTGATNDKLTVTSTGCTFNFGSLDLGSNAYDSVAATFKGTAGNASTIAWNYSTRTLTITLGVKTVGTLANVSSSAPVYTSQGSIRDTGGAALSPTTFTVSPAAKQF